MAGSAETVRAPSWAPLSVVDLVLTGQWRTRRCLALLTGWLGLLLFCVTYGLWPHPVPYTSFNFGLVGLSLFPPLIVAFVVLFWFGLEWAAVLITAASFGIGFRHQLPLEWLIPFSLADAAGLTILALVYRLSRLPYLMSGPATALGYIMGNILCALVLSSGSFFLSQASDATAEFTLRSWISWWLGGLSAAGIAAVILHYFSPTVERWKRQCFQMERVRPASYRAILVGVLVTGVIIGALVFGVSDMVWQRLELTFRSGSMERIERNLQVLRALWLLLSQVSVLLLVGLCLGGVALAWMWSRALDTESRRRANERAEAERRFRVTFEEAPIGIGHIHPDGRFILANAKLCGILGYSRAQLLGLDYFEIVSPAERDLAKQRSSQLLSGQVPVLEFDRAFLGKGGSRVWAHAHISLATTPAGSADYCILVLEDISKRRELEEKLLQTNRMEALGHLAGGVAHDFNNLLTAILGFTEVAQEQLTNRKDPTASLVQVKRGAERAAELTRQLLAFSSRQVMHTQLINLNAEVEESCSLLPPMLGQAICLRFTAAPELPPVLADPTQISQVVVNLAVNARDAMPEGGTVWVRTRLEGQRVVLEVEDEGEGIPEEVLPKIFEPFYTTKARGRGTGLGLATVYGIVQQMGGEIEVNSRAGHGACFRVSILAQPGMVVLPPTTLGTHGRPLAVLLVEDDAAVREFTAISLTNAGHRVTAATCGEDALRLFRPRAFDVLVTDVMMPGIDGLELARALRQQEPPLPLVFVSGFSEAFQAADLPGLFVQKPFSTDRLLAAISEATIALAPASSRPHSEA